MKNRTKRIITILLAAVMIFGTLPISIAATETTESISKVEITDYAFPCHGEKKLPAEANTSNDGLKVTKITYLKGEAPAEAPLSDGTVVTVIFDVECEDGYEFAADSIATVGDEVSSSATVSGNVCSYKFEHTVAINPDKILKEANFDITNFTLGSPLPAAFTSVTKGIKAQNITWEPKKETVVPEVSYTGKVQISSEDGYTYNPRAFKVTVNGYYADFVVQGDKHFVVFQMEYGKPGTKPKETPKPTENPVATPKPAEVIVATPEPETEYIFPFTDVTEEDWFKKDVEKANKQGLINGKTEQTYAPYDNMTYAEAVKLAACMYQLYYDGKVSLRSGADNWYSTYMEFCLKKNIIEEDLSAKADEKITRRDFVKIFYASLPSNRFVQINDIKDNTIPDVMSGEDGTKEIYAFYRAGILTGNDSSGTFAPDSNIIRAEVAAILTRMFDTTARKNVTL